MRGSVWMIQARISRTLQISYFCYFSGYFWEKLRFSSPFITYSEKSEDDYC